MSGFCHQALIYGSLDELVSAMQPFVEEGLAAGDPVLAVTSPRNAAALRERVAGAEAVDFRDASTWYATPGKAFNAYAAYVAERPDAARIRVIGEPVWPVGWDAAVREWARYEAALNVAFADSNAWIVCPYDASSLPAEILGHACSTHPELHEAGGAVPSTPFVDAHRFSAELDRAPLPEPPARVRTLPLTPDLARLRGLVAAEAAAAGVPRRRIPELVLAAHEVAANALTHGGGRAGVRVWAEERDLVCEIADEGPGLALALAGYAVPEASGERGRGIWLARQLCDVVEIRSTDAGTRVRLRALRG